MKKKANSPVVQVVQLESPLERLSDCRTVPYLRFFLVRNEQAGGSSPHSSTMFSMTYATLGTMCSCASCLSAEVRNRAQSSQPIIGGLLPAGPTFKLSNPRGKNMCFSPLDIESNSVRLSATSDGAARRVFAAKPALRPESWSSPSSAPFSAMRFPATS
jgi:hypothetical protein